MRKFLVACLLAWAGAGCTTVPKGLTVELGNSSEEALSNIAVVSDQATVYQLASIDPHDSMVFTPPLEGLPSSLELTWLDPSGKQHRAAFDVQDKLPPEYKGSLHFQVNKNQTLQVFKKPWNGPGAGNQPWARVEDWEGATSIPGLGGQ
jgi:hypothetical protein